MASDLYLILERKARQAISEISQANSSSKGNWKDWSESGKNGLIEFVQLLVKLQSGKAPA